MSMSRQLNAQLRPSSLRPCRLASPIIAHSAVASQTATTVTGPTLEQLDRLCAWSKSRGVQALDKVTAVKNLDGRAVLVAARDIGAGEAVLSVPDSLWLSPEAIRKSSIGKAVEGLEPWLQIALFLISAAASPSTASSEWAPYLTTMPVHPGTPLFWSEQQLTMLKGCQLTSALEGYRSFFDATYTELFGPQGVLAGQPSLFPPEKFTYAAFVAAVATVRARTHTLEGDAALQGGAALVPLADAVAHRRQANTMWRAKSAGLFNRGQSVVVEALRPIRKGEELGMDYGPEKLDGAVLLDYGVMDPQELRPGYVLSLNLDPSDRLLDDKLQVVESTPELSPSMQFPLTPTSTPSDAMLGFLRLSALRGGDVFLLEPIFSAEVWQHMCSPVSEDNERTLCNSMAEGARMALSGYASTIDADLALLRDPSLVQGSPEQMAVQVRLGEQQALDGMQQWFEERIKQLKRLSYYQERRLRRLGLIDDEGRTTYDGFFKDGIA